MKERVIERRLRESVIYAGGMCFKFVSPDTAGVPDRVIITPDGRVVFAELKTETGRLSKIQEFMINEMKKRGVDVRVLYGLQGVKDFLREVFPDEV